MTPIAGFIIAIATGWFVHDGRKAAAAVIVPWLGILALQSGLLAAGHGTSPPSTVNQWPQAIGYWAVQLVFLAFALAIAAMLGSLRRQQSLARGHARDTGRQAVLATIILGTATAAFALVAVLVSAPVRHHSATGSPPLIGFVGMALCVVAVVALGIVTIRRRRAAGQAGFEAAGVITRSTAGRSTG